MNLLLSKYERKVWNIYTYRDLNKKFMINYSNISLHFSKTSVLNCHYKKHLLLYLQEFKLKTEWVKNKYEFHIFLYIKNPHSKFACPCKWTFHLRFESVNAQELAALILELN